MWEVFSAFCLFILGGLLIVVALYGMLAGEKFFFIPLDVLQESTRWVLLIMGSGFLCWLLGAILVSKL